MANQTHLAVIKQTKSNLSTMLGREKEALPKGLNTLRFMQNVLTVLNEQDRSNMKGQEFNLAKCIIKGAMLNLDFLNKECYIITYGGKPEFMTDYKGEIKLCLEHSVRPIRDIYAKVVKEGDEFEEGVDRGQQYINFKSKPFNNGKIIGAFAIVYYKDGGMQYDSMSREEIELVRDLYSKKSKKTGDFSGAWTNSFGEMAKKTVLRRLCKLINITFDTPEQRKAWDESSDMEFNQKEDIEPVKSAMEEDLENNGELNSDTPVDFTDTPFEEVNNDGTK